MPGGGGTYRYWVSVLQGRNSSPVMISALHCCIRHFQGVLKAVEADFRPAEEVVRSQEGREVPVAVERPLLPCIADSIAHRPRNHLSVGQYKSKRGGIRLDLPYAAYGSAAPAGGAVP